MKKQFIFLALAAVLAAGCAKEQLSPVSESDARVTRITVTASDTKLSIGELNEGKRSLFWTKNDQLAANGVASDKLVDSLITEGGTSATFIFSKAISNPVELVYPASQYKSSTSIELPDTPSITSPKIILLGKGNTIEDAITMKTAVAVLYTTFVAGDTPDTDRIRYIEVSSETAQLRGLFTPDYEKGTLTGAETADSLKTIRQNVNKPLEAGDTIIIKTVIPAGKYDLKVKVLDAGGHYMEKALTGKTFVEGGFYSIPATKFNPTGTEIGGIEIANAEDWNTFAEAFNSNPKENSKPIEITGDLNFLLADTLISLGTADAGFPCAIKGNDHVVSDISDSYKSLIYNLASSGSVSNLTIDESCNFLLDYTDSTNTAYCSPLVTLLSGTIENCENKASILVKPYSAEEIAAGKPKAHHSNMYISGFAALVQSGSRILSCTNNGTITIDKNFVNDLNKAISGARIAVGGMAGYGYADKISNCVNKAALTCNSALSSYVCGGITGAVSSDFYNCTNEGDITKENGSSYNKKNAFSEYFAGINGYNWTAGAKYYDCVNNGNITSNGIFLTNYTGGITAYNTKSIDLQRCSNNGKLSVDGLKFCYHKTYIGGLIGYVKYHQTIDLTGCSVTGEISVNIPVTLSDFVSEESGIGGVIGLCGEGATIEGNGFSFTPNIHLCYGSDNKESNTYREGKTGIGGIIGLNCFITKGVTGNVVIKDCHIDGGKVQIDDIKAKYFVLNNTAIGGILGHSLVEGAEISNCSVNSTVGASPGGRYGSGSKIAATFSVGGIAGRISGADSFIKDCEVKNGSKLYANVYLSAPEDGNSLTCGGIIGEFTDSTKNLSIERCKVEISEAGVHRALTGGIAGKVFNTTIDSCSVDLGSAMFLNAKSSAGIVCYIYNGSVSNCRVKATASDITATNPASAIYCSYTSASHEFGGGVVAIAKDATFTNCKSYTNIWVNKGPDGSNARITGCGIGGFVGSVRGTCTFTSCSCGGSLAEINSTKYPGGVIKEGVYTAPVTLSATNVDEYAAPDNDVNKFGPFTYWNGE